MRDEPEKIIPSFDGRYELILRQVEMRMSHSLLAPLVRDRDTGTLVLDLGDSNWSVDKAEWSPGGARLLLSMRRYPGDVPGITVEIDFLRSMAQWNRQAPVPLARLLDELEAHYRAARAR